MNIAAAFAALERGQAVSRKGWGNPDLIVHLDAKEGHDLWGRPGPGIATGPQRFTQEDFDADDWFVVGAIN